MLAIPRSRELSGGCCEGVRAGSSLLLLPELAPPGVALALNPVGMSPRADVVEGLKDARFSVHIVKVLVDAVGWPLEAIVDVLNDEEEGPERLQRAYSFLEGCPADIGRGERTQILENILHGREGGPETDDEGDEDEGQADNERGDLDEDF